jgi:hypothetical protein
MLSVIDSAGNLFAILAAGLGAVCFWFFRLWQGAKKREEHAKFEADMAQEIIKRERQGRKVADEAQKKANENEEKAVEEARAGRRDHFTRQ